MNFTAPKTPAIRQERRLVPYLNTNSYIKKLEHLHKRLPERPSSLSRGQLPARAERPQSLLSAAHHRLKSAHANLHRYRLPGLPNPA